MKELKFESKNNQRVKDLVAFFKKGGAKEEGLIAIEGKDFLDLAVEEKSLVALISAFPCPLYPEVTHVVLPQEILKKLSLNDDANALLGIAKLTYHQEVKGSRLLYLDDVQDPGNVGTLIRTALAFSYDGVILSNKCASLYNRKVIASSKGAIFKIRIYRDILLKTFKGRYTIIASALKGATDYRNVEIPSNFVLVLGNEGQGVEATNLDIADEIVYIPQDHIDSLNVAVAGGILLNYFRGN